MADILDIKIISFPLQDTANGWQGDDVTGHVFRAPTDALGGGLTIVGIDVVNGAATTAGTSWAIQVENWGTAGTEIKSTGGTIAAAIGGTADPFAADTPKAGTISNAFLDAGEWVVLRKTEDNSSDPVRGVVQFHVLQGK